jgi:hypothetical protein
MNRSSPKHRFFYAECLLFKPIDSDKGQNVQNRTGKWESDVIAGKEIL